MVAVAYDTLAGHLYAERMDVGARPSAAEARRDLVAKLGLALVVFGSEAKRVTQDGSLSEVQMKRLLPAGLVSAIGGELEASIAYLALGRWAYASSSLVRQLVEIEYLSWAITNDPEDAWEWFTSDRTTRLQRWQPGKIRQRAEGLFPNSDYHDHCEAGGHPVPEPAMKILDNRDAWVEVTLYEAAVHGSATWHYLLRAVEDLASLPEIEAHHQIVDEAFETWRTVDDLGSAFASASAS